MRERRDEREKKQDRNTEKDVDEEGRRGGLKKKPDMQIYRPGMGRFSSRSIKKDEDFGEAEGSREVSPSKKTGGLESERRGERRDRRRKPQYDDYYGNGEEDNYVKEKSSNKEFTE